ncbi:hypothetical protein MKZ38_008746 [Zalerion maritima]|uniref:Uncharacterized protein n=1 Tax=Zalerion maritima TaxID=339359 RepID=A0AAD5WNG6_9PEZI|nr:hypothetical protein MKZ38_008746 [Zalerion maritima]
MGVPPGPQPRSQPQPVTPKNQPAPAHPALTSRPPIQSDAAVGISKHQGPQQAEYYYSNNSLRLPPVSELGVPQTTRRSAAVRPPHFLKVKHHNSAARSSVLSG